MKIKIIPAAVVILFLAVACKSQYHALLESNDNPAKYAAAMTYFSTGKYNKASQLFESLSLAMAGTPQEDTVQYYWGMSNYRQKDYASAQTNFSQFVDHYPRSPFAEQAKFYRLECMYKDTNRYSLDQTQTYQTITAISEYLIENPSTENYGVCQDMLQDLNLRLEKKAFEGALLYYKMEDYKASAVAFKNVLKDNSETVYREEILYYTAMSSYKYANLSVKHKQKDRFLVFQDDYYNFISEYPESAHRAELDKLFAKVREGSEK